jgi:hypothetical protein
MQDLKLHLFFSTNGGVPMLELFIVLGCVYLLYMMGMKNMLRYRLYGKMLHEYCAYASYLTLGGVISVSITLPLLKQAATTLAPWELAVLPTILAIAIGEVCYYRNQKWTMRFVDRTLKAMERHSRTKRM